MSSFVNVQGFNGELVEFFRNADIFTTASRGVTRAVQTFNGDGGNPNFTLTSGPVHNLKTVTVSAVAQHYLFDYTYNPTTKVVTFIIPPGVGVNNVSITYDHGTWVDEKVFSQYPRRLLKSAKFPRLNIDFTSIDSEESGLGGGAIRSVGYYDVAVWANDPRDYVDAIRSAMQNAKALFYYAKFVSISFTRGPVTQADTGNDILQATIELRAWFAREKP